MKPIKWTYNKDRALRTRKGAKGQTIIHREFFGKFKPIRETFCSLGPSCPVCGPEVREAEEWANRRLSKKGAKPKAPSFGRLGEVLGEDVVARSPGC